MTKLWQTSICLGTLPSLGRSSPIFFLSRCQHWGMPLAMALVLCTTLAACGTSSSSARSISTPVTVPSTTVTSPPPSGPPNPNAYNNQVGLASIRAAEAYESIKGDLGSDAVPGEGVTIGVLDSGIHVNHEAFAGKTIRKFYLNGAREEDGSGFSHGTAVASIAAAVPGVSSDSMQGVAPGADLVAFAIPLGSPPRVYSPISLSGLRSANARWNTYIEHVLAQDIDILNLSVGFGGIIENYSEADLRTNFADAIASMAQTDSDNPMLMVWAAGNAHGDGCRIGTGNCECNDVSGNCAEGTIDGTITASSVEILAGLVARIEELQGHTVAVIAKQENSEITDFSNRCGIAADYCILAPGEDITVAYFGPGQSKYRAGSGTSYAAPMVSGGLALIMQRFRGQLSSREALSRLFVTANKEEEYANREIYGQGLMDLEAATTNVGVSSIILADTVDAPGAPLSSTRLLLGPAFGANPLSSLANREVAAFDSLGAPFWHSLDSLAAVRQTSLRDQLQRQLAHSAPAKDASVPLSQYADLGLAGEKPGFLGLAGPSLLLDWSSPNSPVAATALTTEGRSEQPPTTGAALTWNALGLHMGLVAERSSMLGTAAKGGFGNLSAHSLFAGLTRSHEIGHWRLTLDAEAGMAGPSTGHGMLASLETVTATRLALHASRAAGRQGKLRLSLEQPLRVERARATLVAPVGRTKAGEVMLERWQTDLAPSGRQVDLSAWWTVPAFSGLLNLGAIYSRHPGHDADATPNLSVLAGYRLAF